MGLAQVDACGWGRVKPMWRPTLKIIFYTCNCNISMCTIVILLRGHPFTTSTRRVSGSGGCMWTGEPMWRSTLKIIFYTCNCNISMCTIVILFKGSSIYYVHTEGVWLRCVHVDRGGSSPCGGPR